VEKALKSEETPAGSTLIVRERDQLRISKEAGLASALAGHPETQLSLAAVVPATNVFFFAQSDTRAKYRRNFNSPPVPPVLRSFQLEQNGSNVRVIDADGSVYEGVAEQSVDRLVARGHTDIAVARGARCIRRYREHAPVRQNAPTARRSS
jgi:hypothetical protein